jgi:lauroyl/myristoyl acyltransferase
MRASALYCSELWRAGLFAARVLPAPALQSLARMLALGYFAAVPRRREVVTRNLLAPLQWDRAAAQSKSRELFQQFGLKLADLWRYESGHEIGDVTVAAEDWNRFDAARANGRGLLLLTPHLGNWEFGAPLLRKRGISLQVITQAEPQAALTKLREASRARQGIETVVIGENPFAFVEVIRRLENGATVALLVDRPPPSSAVTIKLFGRCFPASIAPAELARASGCALLPGCIVRGPSGYEIRLLSQVLYDRAALGSREARANLTQEIMKVFEPVIRQHLDQWFHFVPIWEREEITEPQRVG